ncbi:penicillin-binding protein activator LpoB [bacterium]|nr:penicillin-binding protein activator LpoB [bacterium]
MAKNTVKYALSSLLLIPLLLAGCAKESFEIRDVDPGKAGEVRSLGPESQDVKRVADLMMRSLLQSSAIQNSPNAPTIAMLPMVNNTRYAFNKEVFTTLLKAQLNRDSDGAMYFIGRDAMEDIEAERDAKRAGEVDFDPDRETRTVAGADFFLKGRVDGLSTASREGQSDYMVYAFKLIDAESGIEVWEDLFEVKKEGRDDVIYR